MTLLASVRRCTKESPSLTIAAKLRKHPASSRVPLNLIREQENELRIMGELVVELRQQEAARCLAGGARTRQTCA